MPKHIYPIINYATKYTEYSMLHLTTYHEIYTNILSYMGFLSTFMVCDYSSAISAVEVMNFRNDLYLKVLGRVESN